jgi:hypothetical protein
MYHNWVANQEELRRMKPEGGAVDVPADRGDMASEQLQRQLQDLAERVRMPEESPTEALSRFLENLLHGGSPADHDSPTKVGNDRQEQFYGRDQRAAGAGVGQRAARSAEVEIERNDDDDDKREEKEDRKEEGESHAEAASLSTRLDRVVRALEALDKRISSLELERQAAAAAAAPHGRSLEARGPSPVAASDAASAPALGDGDGIVRRGTAASPVANRFARAVISEVLPALRGADNAARLAAVREMAADALGAIQIGLPPVITDPLLQSVAEKCGIAYQNAAGRVVRPGAGRDS